MADGKNDDELQEALNGLKEETLKNIKSTSEQETRSSMLIQSPKISSQFASPLSKRSFPESTQTEQSFRSKRAKYNYKDSNDNESCTRPSKDGTKEKKDLEIVLRKKEDMLRKLKLVKMYRSKNNLSDLEELIRKWRSTCQQAAQDLYEKFNQKHPLTMGQFLDGMRVKHDLLHYSEDDETFY